VFRGCPLSPSIDEAGLCGDRTPTVLVGVFINDGSSPVKVESAGDMVDPALVQAVASRGGGAGPEYGGGGLESPSVEP